MIRPELMIAAWRRLLPPAVAIEDIHAAIAIDVSHAETVRGHETAFRDGFDDPRTGGIRRVRLGVAYLSFAAEDEFRLAIAINVAEQRDFGLNRRDDLVAIPAPEFTLWIYV